MCISCDSSDIYKYDNCINCYFKKRRECLETNNCFFCRCKLRPFKSKKDWLNRIAHKKCWKKY